MVQELGELHVSYSDLNGNGWAVLQKLSNRQRRGVVEAISNARTPS
jgi:hypothetical protein